MSFQPEQPFHERESRYFLAEILKTSDVPLADLVKTIQDRNVVPQWELMALPNGRSLASCRHQFGLLTNRVSSVLLQAPPPQPPPPPYGRPAQPRAALSQTPAMSGETLYAPHQYQFAPINDPGHPAAFHTAPYNPAEAADKTGKKRGRPSKQERELREAEARSRGEVYQPTKRKKAKERQSTESGEIGVSVDPDVSKKKPRLSDPEVGPPGPSPTSYYVGAPNVRTSPSDQMQVDTPERQGRTGGSGAEMSQASPPLPQGLLAGMQQEASRSGSRPSAPQVSSAPAAVDLSQSSAPVPKAPVQEIIAGAEQRETTTESGRDS